MYLTIDETVMILYADVRISRTSCTRNRSTSLLIDHTDDTNLECRDDGAKDGLLLPPL